MASQQYNLRWNNHTNNLLHVLEEQFENEVHVDVTLSCQGKFIKAHKIILGACSPYFQEIFNQHDQTTHPVIIMSGLKFEDIRAIVEFMYRGEVKVCDSDLEQLLAAAESLQVKGLSNVRATRPGQNQNARSEVKPKNTGGSTVNANNTSNSDLTTTRSLNGGYERGSNSTVSSISASNAHATTSHSGGRAHHTLTNNVSGNAGNGNSDNLETNGTPMHLRRKRARISPKDVKENTGSEIKTRAKASAHPGNAAPTVVEDDNSNDLPLTIKIEPPYIRDIDEEDEVEWESQKDATAESCDGQQEMKGVKFRFNSLDKTHVQNEFDTQVLDHGDEAVQAPSMEKSARIPRPPNAFMIFANEWRRKLATQHSNESNKEISVRLGIMWKNLPGDSKEDYFAASRQANEDHKKKYPDYYYSPKEARMRKKWKLQQQQVSQMMTAGQYNPIHLCLPVIVEDGRSLEDE